MFKENSDAKQNKENGDLRARLHPAQLPSCELKKSLGSEGSDPQQETAADVTEQEAKLNPHQASELVSFVRVVLALRVKDTRKELWESPSAAKKSCKSQACVRSVPAWKPRDDIT